MAGEALTVFKLIIQLPVLFRKNNLYPQRGSFADQDQR
jgi:hypothetical protein